MRGRYHGKVGAFPCEFVDVMEDLPGPRKYEGWPKEWAAEAPAGTTAAAPANGSSTPATTTTTTTKTTTTTSDAPKAAPAATTTLAQQDSKPLPKPLPKPRAAGESTESKLLPAPKPRAGASASETSAPAPTLKPAAKPAAASGGGLPTARVIKTFSATNDEEMSLFPGQEVSCAKRSQISIHFVFFPITADYPARARG